MFKFGFRQPRYKSAQGAKVQPGKCMSWCTSAISVHIDLDLMHDETARTACAAQAKLHALHRLDGDGACDDWARQVYCGSMV